MENAPANEQQAEPQSVESLIADNFDKLEAEETEETEETEVEEVEVPEETEEADEPEETEDPEETEVEDPEEPEEPEETEETEEPEYDVAPPERWPQEAQDWYKQLDSTGKRVFMENMYKPMQRQYTKSTQAIAETRKQLEPMLEAMNQYKGDFDRSGANPVELFRQQVAWAAHIQKVGPEQGLQDMAKAYNVNTLGQQEEVGDQYLTPVEREMKAQMTDLQTRLDQQAAGTQQDQQARIEDQQRQAQASVQMGLREFVEAKKDGKLLHPHVEKLAPRMTGLIRGGLVDKVDQFNQPVPIGQQLGQAYKLACELDPTIRTARVQTTRKKQVERAKAANRGVTSKTPAAAVDVPTGPIGDTISDLYDKLDR